jgi:phytoene synthase
VGRVYLPLEGLARFDYTEENLGASIVDEHFVDLVRFEIGWTRRLYAFADEGMRYIPRGKCFPVFAARELYAAILDRIEAQGYDVLSRQAETSRLGKLRVAARCAARNPQEILAGGPCIRLSDVMYFQPNTPGDRRRSSRAVEGRAL